MGQKDSRRSASQLPTLYKGSGNCEATSPLGTSSDLPSFPPLLKGKKLRSWKRAGNGSSSPAFLSLADLLARGYLRLLVSGSAELAPIPAPHETLARSPNCLDVAGRAKHELDRDSADE